MNGKWVGWIQGKIRPAKLNQQVNILFVGIMTIYTFVMFLCVTVSSGRSVREYALKTSEDVLTSVGGSIQGSFETISTMSKMLMYSDEILSYLTESESHYRNTNNAIQHIYTITNQFPRISSVYVFKDSENFVNVSDNTSFTNVNFELLADANWIKPLVDRAGATYICINGDGLFELQSKEPLLTFLRIINNPETQKTIGILAVNYSMNYLENILKDLGMLDNQMAVVERNGIFLCGEDGILAFDEIKSKIDQSEDGKFSFSKGKWLYTGYQLPGTPLELIKREKITIESYYAQLPWMLLFAMFFLSVISFFTIRMFITVWLTRPLEKLIYSMKQVESGWLHRVSMEVHTEEIRTLKESYNQMLIQVNRLINELVENEKIAQQSKLDVMLEQINPHFLYNTLETISYMALESPREEIYEAVQCLGEFYRFFLNNGQDQITLGSEITIVKDYLRIQKFRYGEILYDCYEIEPECLDMLVPKLILQPLVENSLYHGIRPKGEIGKILIKAYRQGELLVLSVWDDGIGLSRERIQQVLQEDKKGIGLKKTLERLKCMYELEENYIIESEEGSFFCVTMFLPFHK